MIERQNGRSLAKQSSDGETLSTEQLGLIGVSIVSVEKGFYIEKVHCNERGIETKRAYDTRWIAKSVKDLDPDRLFPSFMIAQISVSVKIGKGLVL